MVRTRAALREAMLALVEQKPFDQITIRDITAQSGTGYATFFRHYRDKAELLNDLAADEIAELIKLTVLLDENTMATARAVCRHVDQHRKLWSALLLGGAAGVVHEDFIRQARAIAASQPRHTSWLPDDLKVLFGVSAAVEIFAWWLQKPEWSVEQAATILNRLVIDPMLQKD